MTDETPDSLRLSWTVAKGPFDSFVVQYWDTDRQPQALLVGGDQNKVVVSGLEPNTPYKFFLYGLHEGKRLGPVSAQGTTGTSQRGPCIVASPASTLGLGRGWGVPRSGEHRRNVRSLPWREGAAGRPPLVLHVCVVTVGPAVGSSLSLAPFYR